MTAVRGLLRAECNIVQPIHELLSRIRWDAEFGRGRFELGYLDRVQRRIVPVSLHEVRFPEDQPGVFELLDSEGNAQTIPFHRVREVRKDGVVIGNGRLTNPTRGYSAAISPDTPGSIGAGVGTG